MSLMDLPDEGSTPVAEPNAASTSVPVVGDGVAPKAASLQEGQAPAPAAIVMPEGLPDAYWADGKLNVEAIKALHDEATTAKTTQAERAALLPADGVYKIALPEDLKDDAGNPIQIDETAPAYKVLLEASAELKLTPAEASKFAEKMVRLQIDEAKAEAQAEADRVQAEAKLLGADPKARIEAVRNGFLAQLGDEAADLLTHINTAKGVIAAEKVLAKLNGTNLTPNPLPNANGGNRPTAAQVLYPNTPRS